MHFTVCVAFDEIRPRQSHWGWLNSGESLDFDWMWEPTTTTLGTISGSTGQIITKLSPCGRYLLWITDLTFFFWLVKGRCHATNLGSKLAKSTYLPSFVALAFQNGREYRNSTLCVNLVRIGPVTPEYYKGRWRIHPRRSAMRLV